jgi:two-component system response regulator PilR (NtrC family)
VRELENVLERAMALSDGSRIGPDEIQVRVAGPRETREESHGLGERLDSLQREAIRKALEANRWNKTAAARQLGLTLRALRYRMQKLGLD